MAEPISLLGFNTGISMPNFSNSGFGGIVTIVLAIVLITIIAGLGIWWWYMNRIYNRKIIIFENIAGQGYQPTGKDTARLIKIGDGGEELLFLRGRKVYRTAYGRKMGKNTYWFAVGQDGYWYNTLLGDLDTKMGMLDIEPIDRDMRYMHVAIRKNIQERYRKLSVGERYAPVIISIGLLLVFFIGNWFMITKTGDLINQAAKLIEAAKPIAESMQQVAAHMDTLCSGGAGVIGA